MPKLGNFGLKCFILLIISFLLILNKWFQIFNLQSEIITLSFIFEPKILDLNVKSSNLISSCLVKLDQFGILAF